MAIDTSNLPAIPDGFQLKDSGQASASNSSLPPIPDGFQLKNDNAPQPNSPSGTPFWKAMGQKMSPEEISASGHPIIGGLSQTAQDIGTIGEKAINGLTFGGYDKALKSQGIQPPNFDNTAPENKPALNMAGDIGNMAGGTKAIGVIGGKIVAPAVKYVAKDVPEGLKKSSYALMQSIVNQLPKEFKYGANAGRAMVKEGFSGDATAIKEQADKRIEEIGSQGDSLASASNKPVNNSNAMKIIDDKIAELQAKSPRTSASTINKLTNAKKDLLGVVEDDKGIVINQGKNVSQMTPKETLDLKRNFDDQTAWKGTAADDTVFNKTMQQARTQLKNNLNDATPGMKDWNQRYADLRAAQQAAGRKATYDQANVGMKNLLTGAIRGTVGITTLGAALHGNGELAGEILAGWGAKEVLGNPMVKSKVAQMLYGASELDKSAIFKAVPWLRNGISDAMNNFRQKPTPRGEPVDAELIDNRPKLLTSPNPILRNDRLLPSDADRGTGPVMNQDGYVPPGLPNNAVGRRGVNPDMPMAGLPDPGNSAIRQPGLVPKALAEPFQGRSGVDRPWENKGLPSPRQAGQSSGPVIKQGTSYVPPQRPIVNAPPKYGTNEGNLLYGQMKAKENIPLHPSESVREFKDAIYAKNTPEILARNIGIKPEQVDNLADIKEMLDSSEKGTNEGVSYQRGKQGESFHWGTKSNVPEFLKSKYTTTTLSDMLGNKLSGGKVTPAQSLVIKKLISHFFPKS